MTPGNLRAGRESPLSPAPRKSRLQFSKEKQKIGQAKQQVPGRKQMALVKDAYFRRWDGGEERRRLRLVSEQTEPGRAREGTSNSVYRSDCDISHRAERAGITQQQPNCSRT